MIDMVHDIISRGLAPRPMIIAQDHFHLFFSFINTKRGTQTAQTPRVKTFTWRLAWERLSYKILPSHYHILL